MRRTHGRRVSCWSEMQVAVSSAMKSFFLHSRGNASLQRCAGRERGEVASAATMARDELSINYCSGWPVWLDCSTARPPRPILVGQQRGGERAGDRPGCDRVDAAPACCSMRTKKTSMLSEDQISRCGPVQLPSGMFLCNHQSIDPARRRGAVAGYANVKYATRLMLP